MRAIHELKFSINFDERPHSQNNIYKKDKKWLKGMIENNRKINFGFDRENVTFLISSYETETAV